MKIDISDIPKKGLNFHQTVQAQDIGLSDDDFQCLSLLTVAAKIEKFDDEIIADTQISGKYSFICVRCLEETIQERTDQFKLYFDIDPTTEFIDLGEGIRQEIILGLPHFALCRADCKGLCPECGINLNETQCKCPKKVQNA